MWANCGINNLRLSYRLSLCSSRPDKTVYPVIDTHQQQLYSNQLLLEKNFQDGRSNFLRRGDRRWGLKSFKSMAKSNNMFILGSCPLPKQMFFTLLRDGEGGSNQSGRNDDGIIDTQNHHLEGGGFPKCPSFELNELWLQRRRGRWGGGGTRSRSAMPPSSQSLSKPIPLSSFGVATWGFL